MKLNHILTNEELTSLVQEMLSTALAQNNVTDAAVGGSASVGITAEVRLGEVEVIEFHRDKSLELTVYKGQRKGSVAITDLSPAAIEAAVKGACRIAEHTEADPYAGLADQDQLAKEIVDLDLYHAAAITAEQAIAKAKECERAALEYSKEIVNSEGGTFSTNDQLYVYGNSRGFLASYPTTRYSAYCVPIGQRNDRMQRDNDYTVARDVNDLMQLSQVGKNAAERTIQKLGARKISTCQAPVLLLPRVAVSFWNILLTAISGGNLFRKNSFLLDRLDTSIFPDFINITEQPHLRKALGSAPFDAEGVATRYKDIVKDGVLTSYLLGSYAARQLGMQTTGNAGGVHNMVITPGFVDLKSLLKNMGSGLVVSEIMGDGTNIVTGDYSHGAAGFWVENGEIAYPVEEITIAGNLRDMFANIIALGNDVDRRSNVITGSVLLDKMTIAGN